MAIVDLLNIGVNDSIKKTWGNQTLLKELNPLTFYDAQQLKAIDKHTAGTLLGGRSLISPIRTWKFFGRDRNYNFVGYVTPKIEKRNNGFTRQISGFKNDKNA